jgi:hypothetical protein
MKVRRWRYAAVCSIVTAVPVYTACIQPPATSDASASGATGNDLEIEFSTMYTGYDGVHDFKLPARIDGAKNIKWSASPSGVVEFLKGSTASETMIHVINAPTDGTTNVTITAKVGSLSATAPLTITGATPEMWQEGSDRYNDGVNYSWGHDHDGGGESSDGGHREHPPPDPHLACSNCHNQSGDNQGEDVEHTPTQTGGYSDQDLINIVTQATKPAGIPQRIMPLEQWQKIHKWQMDPQQLSGIVVYLRSLEPKSQGAVDFPGQHMGHGGHDQSSKDGGSSK